MSMGKNFNKEWYSKLLQFRNKTTKKNLTICPAIEGSDEVNPKYKKIMFVGRSINGWCPLSEDDNQNIKQIEYCESCRLDWMTGKNRNKYCSENCIIKQKIGTLKNKGPANSRFISMMREITLKINNTLTKDNWYEPVVWNNLYKLSYLSGGNPDGLYNQKSICDPILVEDIKRYQPEIIVFITERRGAAECTWFCQKDFPETYKYLTTYKGDVFITKRPEFVKKEEVVGIQIEKKDFEFNIKLPNLYINDSIDKYINKK